VALLTRSTSSSESSASDTTVVVALRFGLFACTVELPLVGPSAAFCLDFDRDPLASVPLQGAIVMRVEDDLLLHTFSLAIFLFFSFFFSRSGTISFLEG
jgi:hypothetical protein